MSGKKEKERKTTNKERGDLKKNRMSKPGTMKGEQIMIPHN